MIEPERAQPERQRPSSDLGPELERALGGALPGPGKAEACLPAEDLAAFAEGRLLEELRPAAEQHLAACEACRSIAALLAPQGGGEVATSPTTPAPAGTRWMLAAALLLGTALLAWALLRTPDPDPDPAPQVPSTPLDPEGRLVTVLASLKASRPDLFGSFAPLDTATLRAARPSVLRGGLQAVGPREVVLSTRPTFRWQAVAGAQEYVLGLRGEDGALRFEQRVTGLEAALPAEAAELPRGTEWMWTVSAQTTERPVQASLAFRVATSAEAERFGEALRVVRAQAPADLAMRLGIHFALRHGLLEEAERLLEEARSVTGDHEALEDLSRYLRARLDLPEPR